jgi:hypothetical protein
VSRILCKDVLEGGNEVVTSPCAGKKIPENITEILTDSTLHLVWTISEYDVPKPVTVNSDQAGVTGGLETWAPCGSKQVEVIGKNECQSFTLMVGISMSGEVLPFQVIYASKTALSLPSANATNYAKATEELKFYFESSGNDTYWLTIGAMKSYVANILAPYFESHHQQLRWPNQFCI